MSSATLPIPALGVDRPAINPWFIAITVTLATFMELLDTSIANVALPHIAGGLAAGAEEATWVLSSYLVANAVVLPLSAWLSRVFGRKNYYMGCVTLFTLSSLACGMAPSLPWLIFFRVCQGVGGGGLAPCEQAILVDTFPASQRAKAFGIYSFAIVAAPAIGPTLGGWITDTFDWRWIFVMNIPVGILSLVLTSRLVSDPPEFDAERKAARATGRLRIDYLGILFVALAFGCMEVVLDKGEQEDWFASNFILLFSTISVSALLIGIWWECRHKDPVVDLSLLRNRNFAIANVFYFSFGFVLFGSTVLVPQMLQGLFGYTATQAGEVLTPGALVIMVLIPFIVRANNKFGPRVLIAIGYAIIGLSMFNFASFTLDVDHTTAVYARMLQGLGIAFLFVPTSTVAYSYLPKNKNNKASSLTNLFRNLGGSCGIAYVTTMGQRRAQFHQGRLGEHVTEYSGVAMDALHRTEQALRNAGLAAGDAAAQAKGMVYHDLLRQASMLGYIDNFWVLGFMALGLVPLTLLLKKVKSGGDAPAH